MRLKSFFRSMANPDHGIDRSAAGFVDDWCSGNPQRQRRHYELLKSAFESASIDVALEARLDLFHDAVLLLWDKIESRQIYVKDNTVVYRSLRGEKPIPNIIPFFIGIARNLAKRRNDIREIPTPDTDLPEPFIGAMPDEEADSIATRDAAIRQCILSMPDSCRRIITEFYLQEMTFDEMMESRPASASRDALRVRKSKCLAMLRRMIHDILGKWDSRH